MEISSKEIRTKTVRCPECLNYMKVTLSKDGAFKGKCKVCKNIILSKQYSDEKVIRIVRDCNT